MRRSKKERKKMKLITIKFLFLLFSCAAIAQPSLTRKYDYRIEPSDWYKETYPDYSICQVQKLSQVDDVTGTFSGGQCLVRNTGNTAWIGGVCGTGGGGGQVSLRTAQSAVFQIPTLADTTLTTVSANTAVFHNIASFTGTGLTGILTPSVVSNIARVTIGAAGYVNVHWQDEVEIKSSTAGNSGGEGEFEWILRQYGSNNTRKKSWIFEHTISDPITSAHQFPIDITTGLTSVSTGDYFTVSFAFVESRANRNVVFNLPADNAALDERLEFLYFASAVQSGGSGFDFTANLANPQDEWIIPLQQKSHLTASLYDFTTAACPSGWGTACWSVATGATAGSASPRGPPNGIVLLSNSRIANSSANDKRIKNIWIGSTEYSVNWIRQNGLLGGRTVVFADISPQLPGSNWQNVKFEFTDGTFAPMATDPTGVNRTANKATLLQFLDLEEFTPTPDNIYSTTEAIIKAGDNITITPDASNKTLTIAGSASGSGALIALDNTPTDLTPYAQGQVLRTNNPSPGKWLEVSGADAGELHSFQTTFAADANNALQSAWSVGTDLNYGYSSFGDIFGALFTADGGLAFTASNTPVMRMEIEQEVSGITRRSPPNDDLYSFTTTYTLLIRKTDLTSAPATIYIRFYTGVPANNNQVTTVELRKGTDNPAHLYHTYIDNAGANIGTEDILSVKYFNLFRSNPATGDQVSNPLNLHEAKSVVEIDAPGINTAAVDARVDAKVPRQFRSDADVSGQYIQPKFFWFGTAAQLRSATKVNGGFYFTPKTSQ